MATDELGYRTARSLAASIRARELSPVELVGAALARADQVGERINALVWRNDDEARRLARDAADAVVHADPADLPPFHGVPIPIKDLTEVAGWPVTYGSFGAPEGLSDHSELIVEAFQRAGFILTGRTNTPEFGPITASENVRYGVTRNPWDLDRTPGGSSGGAGAAVAAGIFPVAHGNDGGGSIRIPASCCGLVGLKVSRGRIPRLVAGWEGGVVEGALTRDVADTAAILDVTCGQDRYQWYNAPAPERPFISEVGADPGRLRIGLVEEPPLRLSLDPACRDAARQAGEALEGLGHDVEPARLDASDEFVGAFLNVVNTGLATYDGIDWEKTEPHIQAGLAAGKALDSISYLNSVQTLQRETRRLMARWDDEFDVLVTPTMTIEPPLAGEILAAVHASVTTGVPALQVFRMAVLTSPFNMSGQPAISLPTYMTPTGLPIGVQLVGGPFGEARLLQVAAQLESALPWAGRRPPI